MADASEVLTRVNDNLIAISSDPTVPLDYALFDQAQLVLPSSPSINDEERQKTIIALAECLPKLQQDPSPVTGLLEKLLGPYSYSSITRLLTNATLTDGLVVGPHMVAINSLVLTILDKAALTAADAALVATSLETIQAVVKLWLGTNDAGIANRASNLLINLLRVDQELAPGEQDSALSSGQGLVWKRLFSDYNVYASLFEPCSLLMTRETALTNAQVTISQARLMDWLPQVGRMNWNAIAKSHHPKVEAKFDAGDSLLDFAALNMVDYKTDILMYRTMIDFYSTLLSCSDTVASTSQSTAAASLALQYLISHDVHTRIAALYLHKDTRTDPIEAMLLPGPAARYLATYAISCPEHLLTSELMPQISARIRQNLDLTPGRWAHGESPLDDLHLLASLPRRSLLQHVRMTDWHANPLSLLSCTHANPDIFHCLAAIFRGPAPAEIRFPPSAAQIVAKTSRNNEASEARALYYHYLAHNPDIFRNIVKFADTIALEDVAIAAIGVMTAVITANWAAPEDSIPLPTHMATPDAGWQAILAPPALEHALPYLLAPPRTFTNLVGGRGDAESAAYKVGAAKLDALRALEVKLGEAVRTMPGQGYEDILAQVSHRLSQGWARDSGEVGARIATMDL